MGRQVVACGVVLLVAVTASSGPLPAPASSIPAAGQLEVFGALFEGQGTLSGSLTTGGVGVVGGTFVGTQHPFVDFSPVTGATISVSNQPGFFAGAPLGTGAPLVGTMPVRGVLRLTGFGGVTLIGYPFAVPMGTGAVTAGLGVGGTVMGTVPEDTLTASFGPWNSGVVTITGLGESGTGTAMGTGGYFPGPPARLQLVTPVRVVSTLTSPLGWFATLTYELAVPEPVSSGLLAVGAIVLAATARRKRR